MQLSGSSRWLLRLGTALTLAFLYIPLIVIAIYAFNSTRVQKWPPVGLTFDWFSRALHNPGVREALWTSVKAGLGATAVALVLGTMASIARRSRSSWSCRSRCPASSPGWR
jgi:putative spermidine/putrescine transport system permease protein